MSAANRMSYVFLTRQARETADTAGLLESVRNETELVRRYGLGLLFLGNIASVLALPGLLKWLLSGERCFATTILSNFGNVTRQIGGDFPSKEGRLVMGNVRLERWHVAAPVRHLTRAAFSALTYAGRLNICLQCDPPSFPGLRRVSFWNVTWRGSSGLWRKAPETGNLDASLSCASVRGGGETHCHVPRGKL